MTTDTGVLSSSRNRYGGPARLSRQSQVIELDSHDRPMMDAVRVMDIPMHGLTTRSSPGTRVDRGSAGSATGRTDAESAP